LQINLNFLYISQKYFDKTIDYFDFMVYNKFVIRNEVTKMEIGEYIFQILNNQGRRQKWLAEQLNMSEAKLSYKINNNAIKADELIKISKLLNIDLNKLKEEL